jgi:hypothetical protein
MGDCQIKGNRGNSKIAELKDVLAEARERF